MLRFGGKSKFALRVLMVFDQQFGAAMDIEFSEKVFYMKINP